MGTRGFTNPAPDFQGQKGAQGSSSGSSGGVGGAGHGAQSVPVESAAAPQQQQQPVHPHALVQAGLLEEGSVDSDDDDAHWI